MSLILQIWDNFYVISLQVLTNKTQNTIRVNQDSRPPPHLPAPPPPLHQHIQNSGMFRILAYSKPEAYSEPWYIKNSGILRTRDIFRILGYSETWDIQNRRHTQNFVKHLQWSTLRALSANGYNYFRNISFSCPLVHEMLFLIFTPEIFTKFKKVWGPGTVNFNIPPRSFTVFPLEFLMQIRRH